MTGTQAGGPALTAEHVVKSFGGVVAVDGASISVEEGKVAGLMGANGAGKSTLVSMLSGFLRPDSGTVRFRDTDVSRLGPAGAARLGLIRTFQEAAPIRGLNALDNIRVGMHTRFRGGPIAALLHTPAMRRQERDRRREALELLSEVGMSGLEYVDAGQLTFGQLRFLEVARALAAAPRLLLLDEPSAGLNKVESDMLVRLIKRIQGQGLGFLVIDHSVPFLFEICERITVMNFGRVIAEGPPELIEGDPAVRAAYLGTEEVTEAS